MTKLIVAFRNLTPLTKSHFCPFLAKQKVSKTQVGNFVEIRPLAVALNQADGKQRNKIFAICFESRIMETELNRETSGLEGKDIPILQLNRLLSCTIVIIIIIFVFPSMHAIYYYIPETNPFYIVHGVAAVLYLQSVLHVMLFRPCNMFCTFTSALSAACSAQYGCCLQFLNFPLSRYVAQVLSESFSDGSSRPVITGVTFAFTFLKHRIYTGRFLYFKIFSAPFFITFLSAVIATSIDMLFRAYYKALCCPVYC
jgi:hypothetical protein